MRTKELAHVYAEGGQFKVNVQGDVVGIVKDFHYKSLHHEIEPLVIMLVDRGLGKLPVDPDTPGRCRRHVGFSESPVARIRTEYAV